MADLAEAPVHGTVNGASKLRTLLALGLLGLLIVVWSVILPIIGMLYLTGNLP